jgi:hypothetical protein
MAYSAEVKEYAKQLYLTVGPEGDHRYSFKEILDKICQEFVTVKKLKRQTIISPRYKQKKVLNTKF